MRGVETKWQRLGDVDSGTETVSRGLEVIQQIWGLEVFFEGLKASLHPLPPSAPVILEK